MSKTPIAVLAELRHHGLTPPDGATWIGSRRDGHDRVYSFMFENSVVELRVPITRLEPDPEHTARDRRRTFRIVR